MPAVTLVQPPADSSSLGLWPCEEENMTSLAAMKPIYELIGLCGLSQAIISFLDRSLCIFGNALFLRSVIPRDTSPT